ncbi:MAG: type IX secretion system membrane protein PorP/SprF [Lewinellaceae bacterium]|nr:type IX secretion system membrane protein PorP/SprF [Lewinellaceae bacterium]
MAAFYTDTYQPHPQPLPPGGGGLDSALTFVFQNGIKYRSEGIPPSPRGEGLGVGLITLLFLAFFVQAAQAQQEPMYTQFMFNKLAYNPASAGNAVSPVVTAIYRNQWMGLDGAPNTQILSFHQPLLNERLGIGANLNRSSIGISRTVTLDLIYAYRIPMRLGHLCIGLQPSVRNFWQNWNDSRLYSPTPAGTDVAIPTEPRNKWIVNFGGGIYYTNPDKGWFAGVAVPRIFPNNIDFSENGGVLSREVFHLNAMGGLTFELKEDALQLIPQLLLKYAKNAPFEAELNTMFAIQQKFYTGLSYRAGGDTNGAGESIGVLAGIQVTAPLFFCLSYDIGLTRLRKFNNGSVEAVVRWYINPPEGTGDIGTGVPGLSY